MTLPHLCRSCGEWTNGVDDCPGCKTAEHPAVDVTADTEPPPATTPEV